jgi:hypothetical protein
MAWLDDAASRTLRDMDEAYVAELLGARVVERRTVSGGYTPAERWVLELDDGRSVFVKAAVNDLTAVWLRKEHRVYNEVRAPFMAELLGWAENGDRPMLILEDLSACDWPPPWTDDRVRAVLSTMTDVAATPPPAWLPVSSLAEYVADGWARVAEDPAPLLATGLVEGSWLQRALPRLVEAAGRAVIFGDRLCHFDVRSDNLCFRRDGSVVLIDWNFAEVGNPRLDLAFWLPSLALETGPAPESVLPGAGPEAAVVAGYFASHCGEPPIPDAPGVREAQRRQLCVALPWACRELGIALP